MDNLTEAVARLGERIGNAAAKSGRGADAVTLLAVTKVFPAEAILAAHAAGLREFGENYVQEFEGKFAAVAGLPDARFHLIGHLQSNKAKRAAELFQVIQTVDSAKLASRLGATERPLEVMIAVKTSGEDTKSGAPEGDIPAIVDAISAWPNLKLTGLMTVPEWSLDPEHSRGVFAHMRELAARYRLPQLSMGMSNDFEVAIEEGSTCVRIGTALFGSRKRA